LLLLHGCSSYKYDKIGEIDNIESNLGQELSIATFSTPLNEDIVIAKYRDLLDEKLNTKNKKQVLRRYGDLLIDKGERLIVSTNREDYRTGKMMIDDAINTYKLYVSKFPSDPDNDYIIYQISRGYELIEKPATSFQYLTYLVNNYSGSSYFQETQFRRGEYLFTTRNFHDSGNAYKTILSEKYKKTNLFNKTLYKYAWVNFKQERYGISVEHFMKLVDFYYKNNQVTDYQITSSVSKGEKEAITDVLRAISLSFSYMGGSQHIVKYTRNRPYTPLLYSSLATLYKNKKRYVDAIDTYREFINKHKQSRHAYKFHQNIISLYQVAGLSEQIVPEKVRFINNFGPGTHYQKNIDKEEWDSLNKSIENNVIDLATYYHAYSKGKQKKTNSKRAEHWYRYYLTHYATQPRAQGLNFRLAELLNDNQQYKKAIDEYEKTAYLYNPKNSKAAYAAISLYEKPGNRDHRWRNRLKNAHLKFYYEFGSHPQADKVLLKASQYQYDDHEYQAAYSSSSILVNKNNQDKKVYASAILIFAHSAFELENYPEAENGYRKAHAISEPRLKNDLWKKAAAAAYLDAKRLFNTNPAVAIQKLTRVGKAYGGTEIAGTASFDAASLLMKQNDNNQAESILISLKNNRSKGFDKKNLHEKLAFIYLNKKQYTKAADEFVYIYNQEKDRETKREILLNIADLYKKGGNRDKAVNIQKEYAKVYKIPLNDYADTVFEIASYYQDTKNQKNEKYWLDKIIALKKTYKTLPKDVNYTVARANLRYAYFDYQKFKAVKLTKPLKKSLKRKKSLMQNVLKKYEQAIDAGEFKLTTEATYNIANIYYALSKDILTSERPPGLSDDEYMQYTIILEDQAYPFEEKSIDIHEKNISLARQGGINKWISRSLDTLSKLQPARYNKHERFVHYVE
jgi:tetratricopeptide (TPR) repeat protein